MINKLWCETVVPILWKNPWRYNINYNNKSYLFNIIEFYLSNDTKEYLIKERIRLPLITSKSPPFFDYLSFCRSININILNTIISIESLLDYDKFLLQQEFYGLFMKKLPELKFLDMRSIKHQIFYFPEAKIRLESLCELKCDTSIDSSYFYGLARICQRIQRLIIINVEPKTNRGITKLIEVQKNLKYFEWIDDFNEDYFTEDPYREIFLELEKKADVLKHLELLFIYLDGFDFYSTSLKKLLPKLHKLKTLITNEFSYNNGNLSERLIYNDLQVLNIGFISIHEASIIIGNSGGRLKEVSLKPCEFLKYEGNFSDNSLIFIRKIYENCPLIEYLSLTFYSSKDHFNELENLLKICQNLKSLLLITSNIFIRETKEKNLENGENLLKILIKSATINLRELRFFNDIKFSLKALEEFLEKWRGRPAITILTSDFTYESEDYRILINNYKNYGVIKVFRRESTMNVEDMNFKI
ncbi:hypothetical protein GLOIN_2v1764020 [Rhizophagus clarus]|nr:hypothetical protein GLOIN_2v1764020 [Rhizophagus clarus]